MNGCVKAVEILLVESNPGDARLTHEVLKDSRIRNRLKVVRDGIEAMAYLHREGEYAQAQRPDLILLELNLPKKDGREVLEELKKDPCFKRIPVVVLTNSIAEQDVVRAYHLHANCYFTKPLDLKDFVTLVQTIEEFWLAVVQLPD